MILQRRAQKKARKNVEIINDGIKTLVNLAGTLHGRILLAQVVNDFENELDPEVRWLYYVVLNMAPVDAYAKRN